MDLESVKRYSEKGGEVKQEEEEIHDNETTIHGLPSQFFERFIMQVITVDFIERGRLLCSMKAPPHLLSGGNFLHGGATATVVDMVGSAVIATCGVFQTGVSVEINVSYMDAAYENEEIEIEARALNVGKAIGVSSVELRKKKTGKIIAQGRHTKYFGITSKL